MMILRLLHGCHLKFLSYSTHWPCLIKHLSKASCLVPYWGCQWFSRRWSSFKSLEAKIFSQQHCQEAITSVDMDGFTFNAPATSLSVLSDCCVFGVKYGGYHTKHRWQQNVMQPSVYRPSISPLIHHLSSCLRQPSIHSHLPHWPSVSQCSLSPHVASDVTNSNTKSSNIARPLTLWPCLEGSDQSMRRQKGSKWIYSETAEGFKAEKQRRTCRLKKTCMDESEKACVPGVSHSYDSEPALPVRALLWSLFLLSALFLMDKTADC